MDEQRKIDFKKRGAIFFSLALFYLTFLFVSQMAFTGGVVWFDGKISVVFVVLSFTLSPMASREMFPTLLGASWRPIVGYAIGFALYVCLDLSICPWQLCDETVVDSVYITGTVLYATGFYVAAWHLGLWGTQAKYTILKWFCYLSAAIVCVFGLWHTLMHWYIWVTRFFLWYIYMPARCFF